MLRSAGQFRRGRRRPSHAARGPQPATRQSAPQALRLRRWSATSYRGCHASYCLSARTNVRMGYATRPARAREVVQQIATCRSATIRNIRPLRAQRLSRRTRSVQPASGQSRQFHPVRGMSGYPPLATEWRTRLQTATTVERATPRVSDRRCLQRDQVRPRYSITSSASASSVGGMSSPSALAVLRLMTSWNLVGCMTGRSPGFSPLRMRPT
jgi:hypothetical protein